MLEFNRKMSKQDKKPGRKPYAGERVSPKPQPTIIGNDARLFNLLMARKDMLPSPLAAWIIGRWLEENKALLRDTYGIEYSKVALGNKVVPHPSSQTKTGV